MGEEATPGPRRLDEDELDVSDAGPVRGGTETILVVEDNEGVRDTVVAMLVELGYRVLKAKDAAGALNVLEAARPGALGIEQMKVELSKRRRGIEVHGQCPG